MPLPSHAHAVDGAWSVVFERVVAEVGLALPQEALRRCPLRRCRRRYAAAAPQRAACGLAATPINPFHARHRFIGAEEVHALAARLLSPWPYAQDGAIAALDEPTLHGHADGSSNVDRIPSA